MHKILRVSLALVVSLLAISGVISLWISTITKMNSGYENFNSAIKVYSADEFSKALNSDASHILFFCTLSTDAPIKSADVSTECVYLEQITEEYVRSGQYSRVWRATSVTKYTSKQLFLDDYVLPTTVPVDILYDKTDFCTVYVNGTTRLVYKGNPNHLSGVAVVKLSDGNIERITFEKFESENAYETGLENRGTFDLLGLIALTLFVLILLVLYVLFMLGLEC